MLINAHNPFKGRQFPGEVIVLCVRWYLRYLAHYHRERNHQGLGNRLITPDKAAHANASLAATSP